MDKRVSGIVFLLLVTGFPLSAQHVMDRPVPLEMPVAPERPSMEKVLAKADSLFNAYCFQDAVDLYLSIGREREASNAQNALNMMDFCADPHVVARQRFSRKDFYLYYPLATHAWRASPNPLDSLEGYPLYYPKGADVLYYSAPDRSGSRSVFITENLDSLWRAPRLAGESLLTTGSEVFPLLSPDGQTLYFASDGLSGMGGFDLYASAWDPESASWGAPVNLGFPFNSPADDFLLMDTEDGKYTLFASNRDCSRDSVYVYVVEYTSSRVRKPVREPEELLRISALKPVKDPTRIDNGSAMSSALPGNATTRLYTRKMEEARVLRDSIAACSVEAVRDSLQALLEEVNLEIRLVEQSFLQSGVVTSGEDKEVVGAEQAYTFAKNSMGGRFKMKVGKHPENHSFRVAPVGRFAFDNTLPPGIVYQIEIFTSPRHASLEDIHGLSPVYERLASNLRYTYSVGLYPTYVGALLDLNLVRAQGFPEARITAYRDGRPIPILIARQEE